MTEVSSSRSPFRRSPGRRQGVRALLPVAVVAAVAAGTALAPSLAAASPALPPISAQALLTKLATAKVAAYSGTMNVTTNLGLPALPDLGGGANPMSLLSGTHVLQVAADGPDQQRIALLDTDSEYDLIHNGQQVWVYDSEQNTVEEGTTPAKGQGKAKGQHPAKKPRPAGSVPLTPAQAVQQLIAAITPTTGLAVADNQSVAGQAAYTLVVTPEQSGSLIDRVEITVDAQNGAPLSFAIYSTKTPNTPVFKLAFTSVSFAAPPASRFEFTAPPGAKVSPLTGTESGKKGQHESSPTDPVVLGQGWLSVLELHGVDVAGGLSDLSQGTPGTPHSGWSTRSGPNAQSPNGLFNGDVGSYLQALGNAGTKVSGKFGSGTLYTTNFITILTTEDGRVFLGAVTPALVEADAAAQGPR